MSDRPLFRNGKATTKVRDLPDGRKLLFKPFQVKDEHLMKMTGAPGWDKGHVDEVFTEGVKGSLRFIVDVVQYDIDIESFREHAFERIIAPWGAQYHAHLKYYKSSGLAKVSPLRRGVEERDAPPELPKKVTFGEWIPCDRCKATGGTQKERCPKCQGLGLLKWVSATSSS